MITISITRETFSEYIIRVVTWQGNLTLFSVGISQQVSNLIVRVKYSMRTMNSYRATHATDQTMTEERQIIATRFYLIIFVFALAVIIIFTTISSQIHSITISSPKQSTFEFLHSRYASTLSCPCSQIATLYPKFLSVKPTRYHQVCYSYFVSPQFIGLLWGLEKTYDYTWNIDLKILSTEFRLLQSLCSLTNSTIRQNMDIFPSKELISVEALTQQSFQALADSIIDHFIAETPTSFRRRQQYIIGMFHTNQLHNLFYTNWNFRTSTVTDGYVMTTSGISYNESGQPCSCATLATCSRSVLSHRRQTVTLPGKRNFSTHRHYQICNWEKQGLLLVMSYICVCWELRVAHHSPQR